MNSVNLIGRLARDPELRYSASGHPFCTFVIAIDRPPQQNGQKVADFIPIITGGKMAEATAQYTKKGDRVGVMGWLRQNRFTDQQGNQRSRLEVSAFRVEFLQPKSSNNGNGQAQQAQAAPAPGPQAPVNGQYQQPAAPYDEFNGHYVDFDGMEGDFNEDDLPF